MDTLAIAIVIAAMAAVVAAVRADARRAVLAWGAVAGGLWLLAVLTQVRVLPILAGMGAGGVWLLVNRRTREPALLAGACGLTVFVAGGLWWMHQMGVTPAEWALTYLRSSRGDTQNVVLAGQSRVWGFELRNMITLVAIVVAGAGSACMLLWGRASRMPDNERIEPALAAVLVAAVVNIAFIFSVANNVFTSSSYFVLPLLAAVLAATRRHQSAASSALEPSWRSGWQWRVLFGARPHHEVRRGMADVGVPGSGSAASVRREVCPGWIAGFRLRPVLLLRRAVGRLDVPDVDADAVSAAGIRAAGGDFRRRRAAGRHGPPAVLSVAGEWPARRGACVVCLRRPACGRALFRIGYATHRRRTYRRVHRVAARLSGYGSLSAAAGLSSLRRIRNLVIWSSGYLVIGDWEIGGQRCV